MSKALWPGANQPMNVNISAPVGFCSCKEKCRPRESMNLMSNCVKDTGRTVLRDALAEGDGEPPVEGPLPEEAREGGLILFEGLS